jgi:hypothetical protein
MAGAICRQLYNERILFAIGWHAIVVI